MKKKVILRPCYACWEGWGCRKENLPRKKKKALKKLYAAFPNSISLGFMGGLDSCNLASEYKRWNGAINALPFLLKYKKQIDYLIACADHNTESVYLNEKGRLCWYWECDSDYGGSSGLMPFCYSKEAAGETWAFSEVKDLIRWMWVYSDYGNREHNDFVFPDHIQSDKELLKFIQTLNQFKP